MTTRRALDDFRLRFGGRGPELVPLMLGGMGVDISNTDLALEVARLGGIGHISDAMVPTVTDRRYETEFTKEKLKKYKYNVKNSDKSAVKFDLGMVREAQKLHVEKTMARKTGAGMVFINCMEKLTMGAPKETLKVRLEAALDAGIDGITLSAGLHLGSFALIETHPRFRDAKLGIIVSSVRALALFLKKNSRTGRLPDYVVVEGPLAGGHLGFGLDWAQYDLKTITAEVLRYLAENHLAIPVIPAGGIFTGTDAVEYLEMGAAAVQVATRFTVTKECGLPDDVKQEYFKANEEDVVVNTISPTGYPMRMLKSSPAIGSGIRPNCESYGYLLDANGHCAYIDAYNRAVETTPPGEKLHVWDKTCLCTHMRNFKVWTCGHYVYRLKDTTRRYPDGSYQLLTAEHVFKDYQYSTEHQIRLPDPEPQPPQQVKGRAAAPETLANDV
ncbi:nitronate monooxygenase [Hydrogenophilus thiooxidans]|uniref:nitronate monooxygenase n=1 Tax=Hydrogenophilus thiooxidans TaxID=2820326 RepID=UPI001C21185E|nr:nitronate monooxygenase [Hydrogenophilus thiooxidans]